MLTKIYSLHSTSPQGYRNQIQISHAGWVRIRSLRSLTVFTQTIKLSRECVYMFKNSNLPSPKRLSNFKCYYLSFDGTSNMGPCYINSDSVPRPSLECHCYLSTTVYRFFIDVIWRSNFIRLLKNITYLVSKTFQTTYVSFYILSAAQWTNATCSGREPRLQIH